MHISPYAIAPLIATLAYIPIFLSTIQSRPWNKRHWLFVLLLSSAILWSFFDFLLRDNIFPQYNYIFFKLVIILFAIVAVNFHVFLSSFFPPEKGRWLVFAFGSLVVITCLVSLGFVTKGISVNGEYVHGLYSSGIIFVFLPLIILSSRDFYVLIKMFHSISNPILHNQVSILMITLGVITSSAVLGILPFTRSVPLTHIGNLINAFILSYSVIRHQLVDIKIVIRRGTAWITLGIIGALSFWVVLIFLQSVLDFSLDVKASFIATLLAMGVSVMVYSLKGRLFKFMNRALQGSSYDFHQQLNDFGGRIHNLFSLKDQGGELLGLLVKAINLKQACLLFPEAGSGDFLTHFAEPKEKDNRLSNLRLRAGNPVIRYLEKEQKTLTRENLTILPAFLGLWPREKEDIESKEISMFVPLISRERLIAVLVLGNKKSGRFSLEELSIIEDATRRVAVSMEKEYLREQLREREEELSVINNSSFILSSSLDIQEIFGSFIEELKKIIDIEWAAIVLQDENDLCCIALSSVEGSAYQVGERIPIEGSGSGWVVTQKKVFIESDLSQGRYFKTGENFYQRGFRTVAYLPLIAKGSAIGSLIITSTRSNAYSQRHIKILEQLTSQIAMPLENSMLYAKAEKKARIDELTGLLNRRSLDEMIDNEISRHSRYGGAFSLAILDLDSFKVYNDTFGHPAGDRLLRQVGSIINGSIRNADRAFRYGGDEFAILLPQTTIEDGLQVTERVRKTIAEEINTSSVPVTISIGLASWPDDGISHTDIIAAADVTLYRAKRSGGNQSCQASGTLTKMQNIAPESNADNSIDINILEVIKALAETVDARSYNNFNHSRRVTDCALALGKALKMETTELSRLEACSFLHDIGKMSIDEGIINKTADLSPEEWEIIKTHPKLGADIAGRTPQLVSCMDGILYHHEHYDGTGYPNGLAGEDIPLIARILAIADSYVAMTSERSYSATMSHKRAIEALQKEAGKQFDPYLVDKFATIEKINTEDKNKARR
jgi:diguanylate cyclase (GGDEF)-like protein